MPNRSSKRGPEDINEAAFRVFQQAVGETPEKNAAAVELGRRGGNKGGKARADSLTPERRAEIAKQAAEKRWGKKSDMVPFTLRVLITRTASGQAWYARSVDHEIGARADSHLDVLRTFMGMFENMYESYRSDGGNMLTTCPTPPQAFRDLYEKDSYPVPFDNWTLDILNIAVDARVLTGSLFANEGETPTVA